MAATYSEKKWNLKCMMKDKYLKNKMKKIHSTCTCPVCKKKFEKRTKGQVFCGSRYDTTCKDAYWNFIRFGTIPWPLYGYFKVLERTVEEQKKDEEVMFGPETVTEEDKKMIESLVPNEMLVESEELANEEKEEYSDWHHQMSYNDYTPVDSEAPFNSYSIPEDDYFI